MFSSIGFRKQLTFLNNEHDSELAMAAVSFYMLAVTGYPLLGQATGEAGVYAAGKRRMEHSDLQAVQKLCGCIVY